MSINSQINNIFHCILHKQYNYPLNIIYGKINTFYDNMVNELFDNICFLNETNIEHCGINYGACFVNDPLVFSQIIEKYSTYYGNKIIFYHEPPPSAMKKEDLYILSKRLHGYRCISLSEAHNLWNQESLEFMTYGVPIDTTINIDDKKHDVLIIDTKKTKHSKILFDIIRDKYQETHIMQIFPNRMKDIMGIISQYKVCVDLDSYYNLLVASSVGCYGITARSSYDPDIIKSCQDMSDIIYSVDKYISQFNNNKIYGHRSYIKEKYDYDIFKSNIKNIIDTSYRKACLA